MSCFFRLLWIIPVQSQENRSSINKTLSQRLWGNYRPVSQEEESKPHRVVMLPGNIGVVPKDGGNSLGGGTLLHMVIIRSPRVAFQ